MININNRFTVNFETNEIMDTNPKGEEQITKVEPRIMKVLEILVKNSPSVVLREKLIKEVWDNYGGADDALNQAISHLRKILNDQDKENRIIETVVKKGYRFAGTATKESSSHTGWQEKVKKHQTGILIGLSMAIAFILLYQFLPVPFGNSGEPAHHVPTAPEATSSDDTISLPDAPAPKSD